METHSPTNNSRQLPNTSKQAALRNMKLNTYMATEPTTKISVLHQVKRITNRGNNLTNAQEAVQLYLNKKNQKGGLSGEEGDGVRIDNSSSLETRAREQELNPNPGPPQATGPVDCRTVRLRLSGIEPP
ncbi:hypothetical protein DSO57_1031519 [Entomophthora muscae]|uniref:Uncharacterized protein n=1 Tax=Entomophthora muscae TaxID=34485 RepID=A0ACC2RFB7_9FUNG|nr:hypothetical protein DSO57_1031519 [Entomophthora muscae]